MPEKEQDRIMLLVTENCNLDCRYCYEHRKNSKTMSYATAIKILDTHLKDALPNVPIVIEVFGGEAFANFSLIKRLDEYIALHYSHLSIYYETTTNGTLVHGEVQEWLKERRERFFISVSLDGTKVMHNMNRVFASGGGTFDCIDIDFFQRTWPGCPAKMTISEVTLPNLAEGVMYLENLGFRCDATLSVGVMWDYEKNHSILVRELNKLVEYYTDYPDKELCTMLNLDLRRIFTPFDENFRFCGAGVGMVCYDAIGNQYPCQGFAPVSIGELAADYHNFDQRKFLFTDDNMCKRCPWVRLCPNCYAANLQSTGNIQKVDPILCEFYKFCILASAKIQCRRILQKKSATHDDQLTLKAVSVIQEFM